MARVYEDNDVSAYKRNVRRPEFELMLSDLAAGLIDGVVSYDLDRLARQPKDLEHLIDIFDNRKRLTFATVTDDIDLSSADGRTMARVMVAFAIKSSHDAARRIKRKHLELALSGKSSGGPAPYGWQKDNPNKVDPEAARHIREAQKEILAGVRIGTIRKRWQEQGIGRPREGTKRMAHHHVELMVTNPRLCGYRTYHGEILLNDDGEPVIGEWETINTVEEWEAVCAAVAERKQANPAAGRPVARKYLLSGIARCGLCHNKIRGQINRLWKPGSLPDPLASVGPPVHSPHGSSSPKSLQPATCPRAPLTSENPLHAAPPPPFADRPRSPASRFTALGCPTSRTTPRPSSFVAATARNSVGSKPNPRNARLTSSAASRASRQPVM
ncbi:recombinase family protein [Streptomyces sp. NPDC004561]